MALGLGEIRSASRLGEALLAEIPLRLESGERLGDDCFRLFKPAGDLPWQKQGRFTVKGKTLILSSERPVVEPILQVGIQVNCGQDLYREYILMLSPPVREAILAPSALPMRPPASTATQGTRVIQAGETPASVAAELYPASRAEQKRFVKALIQSNRQLGLHASRGSLQPLPEGGLLNIPELPPPQTPRPRAEPSLPREERLSPRLPVPEPVQAPASREPVGDRLVLSGSHESNDAPLRLAEVLEVIPSEAVSEDLLLRRKLFRLEYRMLAFLENQAETARLPPQERLHALEAVLGEVAPGAAVQPEPPLISTPSEPERQSPRPHPVAPEAQTSWWYWLFGVLVVLGALGGEAWRRRRASLGEELPDFSTSSPREPRVEEDPFDEFTTPTPSLFPRAVAAPQTAHLQPQPLVSDEVSLSDVPGVSPGGTKPIPVSDTSVDESFSHNPIMELADIMLSFGRIKGAAQALQEYIDQNPKEALQPWVKLLEVYRQAGMVNEFETLAKSLCENFNVELIRWSDVPKTDTPDSAGFVLELHPMDDLPVAPKAKSIEDMPHILQAITSTWGTPPCLDYIQTLLRDNRGGSRQGFPMSVVDELLLLSEILKAEIPPVPLAPDLHIS